MKLKFSLKRKIGVSLLVFLVSTSLFISSCGQNPEQDIVKDVDVHTELRDGDIWLTLGAVFKLGALSMTEISFPVVHPKDPSIRYGEVSFTPLDEEGYNEIILKTNLTFASEIEGGLASLPNGEPLPIAGLDTAHVLQLKIDKINSRIYLALTADMTVSGFAISIKEFEKVGDAIANANIFLGFDIKGILGSVGLFTGEDAMENGLAFFVDLSEYFTTDMINDIIAGKKVSEEDFHEMIATLEQKPVATDAMRKFKKASYSRNNEAQNLFNVAKEVNKLGNATLHFIPN